MFPCVDIKTQRKSRKCVWWTVVCQGSKAVHIFLRNRMFGTQNSNISCTSKTSGRVCQRRPWPAGVRCRCAYYNLSKQRCSRGEWSLSILARSSCWRRRVEVRLGHRGEEACGSWRLSILKVNLRVGALQEDSGASFALYIIAASGQGSNGPKCSQKPAAWTSVYACRQLLLQWMPMDRLVSLQAL